MSTNAGGSPRELGVLVGIDGSDNSIQAAVWAGHEAAARGTRLTLCRVIQAAPESGEYERQTRSCRHDLDRARSHLEGVDVQDLVVGGPASRELIRLSDDAEVVVVGARGRGGFAGLLLGSVSDQAATHARSPVVVVREQPGLREGAPIFLGVDDAPGTRPALEYAFLVAARDRHPVVALHSYPEPVSVPELGYLPLSMHAHFQDRARAFVDGLLEPCRRAYPEVTVTVELTTRSAASALCDASPDARLVVVGATGRPSLAGLLGSTTRKVLHHAKCPVVVARQA
jgi:nucleotide-binding universal stress UspA family protein